MIKVGFNRGVFLSLIDSCPVFGAKRDQSLKAKKKTPNVTTGFLLLLQFLIDERICHKLLLSVHCPVLPFLLEQPSNCWTKYISIVFNHTSIASNMSDYVTSDQMKKEYSDK